MNYVATEDQVSVGEKIVTSGMDKIFPADIPIGTVVDVKAAIPFKQIRVQPAAKLDRLETVIVLLTQAAVEFKQDAAAQNPQNAGAPSESNAQSPGTVTPAAGKP